LASLGAKIANFIVDFHMDWVESLQLPPSDGRHMQLDASHVQRVLDRLQTIQEVHSEVQIFTAVKIGHSDFNGSQFIHCTPFKSRHINTRLVSICTYSYVFVRIRTYSVCISTYSYVSVRICILATRNAHLTKDNQHTRRAGLCLLHPSASVLPR